MALHKRTINELALFAGIGGGILGTHLLGFRTICAVEKEPYCREVLLQRQIDGMLPMFPIWDRVETFRGEPWKGIIDIVSAGFPCQGFSLAGKRLGEKDERNMWPETIRVIREVAPRYAFLENVPGLISSGYFGHILQDLAEAGYDAKWCVLGADDVGAPHRRKRLWILAHSDSKRGSQQKRVDEKIRRRTVNSSKELADSSGVGLERRSGRKTRRGPELENEGSNRVIWWDEDPADLPISESEQAGPGGQSRKNTGKSQREGIPKSRLGKLVDGLSVEMGELGAHGGRYISRLEKGISNRSEKLKALGNAQVPEVVREAWNILYGRI